MPESKENRLLRFYRDYLEMISASGTNIILYDQVYCVNETLTMYCIRTSAVQAITVDKADLSPENAAFIRSIAPEKPGSRSRKVKNSPLKLPDKAFAAENADGELLFETQTHFTFAYNSECIFIPARLEMEISYRFVRNLAKRLY